jgi:hypothetical protein
MGLVAPSTSHAQDEHPPQLDEERDRRQDFQAEDGEEAAGPFAQHLEQHVLHPAHPSRIDRPARAQARQPSRRADDGANQIDAAGDGHGGDDHEHRAHNEKDAGGRLQRGRQIDAQHEIDEGRHHHDRRDQLVDDVFGERCREALGAGEAPLLEQPGLERLPDGAPAGREHLQRLAREPHQERIHIAHHAGPEHAAFEGPAPEELLHRVDADHGQAAPSHLASHREDGLRPDRDDEPRE